MANWKRYCLRVAAFLLLALLLLPSRAVFASPKSAYYDFGPYYYNSYNNQQVLGVTLSSLEQLPVPQIPPQAQIPQATGVLPGSPLHPFETFIENVQLTFTTDPIKREELRLDIAAERLSEAKTLIDQGKVGLAADTVASYKNTMNTVSENMEELAEKNVAGVDSLITKVETAAATQSIAAQALALASPPVTAQAWAQVVDVTEQSMDRAADSLNKPAISDDLSTSIQELKEKGLITPEESSKLYGLDSRTKVREELDKLAAGGQFPIAEITRLDEAVASRFPDAYKQTVNVLQFAELRTYQTLPSPTAETQAAIRSWQDGPADVPPPQEIRPYLYYSRAQDLAQNIDFTGFTGGQQTEVSKFYPQAVAQNPTFVPPSPTPSVVEGPTPPTADQTATSSSTASPASPSGSPSEAGQQAVSSPSAQPYLTAYQGPLPGEAGYFFKQFGEGFSLFTTVDPARRVELNLRFAQERLSEAEALAGDPQKERFYQDTLKRYKDNMTNISDQVKNFRGPEERQRELAENLELEAARHTIIFEKGLLTAPAGDVKTYQEIIETAEKAMDISADVLDKPALPVVLSNRLQDLKAQGLILPEEVDKLTAAGSREEVRQIIRDLTKEGIFPPADAKKLDEAQSLVSFSDYNQLVEVRKVEELQGLRAVQGQLAQTPTLKATADSLSQREKALTATIDTSLIRPEDLAGRADLAAVYQTLQATIFERPINRGQFGGQPPPPTDAVLTVCPEGATFKQSEGCVWADSGQKINDYNQYRCDKAGQYYSFAAKKCVPNKSGQGFDDDAKPVCPVGYNWVWGSQSCQKSTGEGRDPKYSCPDLQYYSPNEEKCVRIPDPGDPFPSACSEQGTYWSFSEQKCIAWPEEKEGKYKNLTVPQPIFVTPDNPFYPVKGWGEFFQKTFAFTPERRQAVSLDQAKERLAEAAYALKKDDKEGVKKAISNYIGTMQNLVADVSRGNLSDQAKFEISKMLGEESVEQNLLLSKLTAWADDEEDAVLNAATSVTILGIDKAADISGEPAIPDDIKAKIEALPTEMISDENKKKLLELDSRVEARIELNNLKAIGGLTQTDIAFIDEGFSEIDAGTSVEIEELKKLAEIADITDKKSGIDEKVAENENIVNKLDEFQKTFEVGKEIPADIRPYVRLTRIEEVAQTVRPDVVNLSDFQNRKDVLLAVATLQQELKPTKEAFARVEDFRRRNPNAALPFDLARIEGLAFSLGVRTEAGPCYLPNPPFPANTPCPAPGAAIPITSYTNYFVDLADWDYPVYGLGSGGPNTGYGNVGAPSLDKDGKPLVYGQGPQASSPGICSDGYHWMYDSGGWCMSNSGNYSSSYNYTPSGTGSGYTPYSPYYTAPGAPPSTYGYPVGDYSPNDGCPYGSDSDGRGNCIPNSYPSSPYSYSPPSYYGPAPNYYTTTPPSGTVPGSGPRPTSSGQCPSGYHWMSDSGGWCMADGGTYVPSGYYNTYPTSYPTGTTTSDTPPEGGYNCGSQPYDPVTKRCRDGACPGGFNWDGSKCVVSSPNLDKGSCGPGYYWSNNACFPSTPSGSGGTTPWCWSAFPPPGGWTCGSGSSWDQASCSCKPSGSTWCATGPPSGGCGYNSYWDSGSCNCRSSSYTGGGGTGTSCSPPSGGCGSGWFDYGSCSCKQSSSQGCYNVSASSCGSGWYFDSAACTCRQSSTSTSTGSCSPGYHWMSDNGGYCMADGGGNTSTSPSTSTSSGSCPSGYHWMSDNGGWCMSDSSSGGSTSTSGGGTSSSGSCPSGSHWMSDNGGYCMSDGGTTSTTTTTTTTTTTESSPTPAPTSAPTTPAPTP